MKRNFLLVSLLVVISLMLSATQVFAAPPTGKSHGNPNPGQKDTPDVQQGQQDQHGKQNTQGNQENKGNKNGKTQNFKGIITAVDVTGKKITLTPSDGGTSQDFTVPDNTQIKIPTLKTPATLEDLLNRGAIVQARDDGTGQLVVKKILVVPGKPIHFHRVGVVTAYDPGKSITIKDKDGGLWTFTLDEGAKILPEGSTPKEGDTVTIISRRDPAAPTYVPEGTEPVFKAQGVVIHQPGQNETENDTETETGEGD